MSKTENQMVDFLIFQVDRKYFGVPLLEIQKLIPYVVPREIRGTVTPRHCLGYIIKGTIFVSVYDPRDLLQAKSKADIRSTKIIVVRPNTGLLVEGMVNIFTIDEANITPADPEESNHITGRVTDKGRQITLLDTAELLKVLTQA